MGEVIHLSGPDPQRTAADPTLSAFVTDGAPDDDGEISPIDEPSASAPATSSLERSLRRAQCSAAVTCTLAHAKKETHPMKNQDIQIELGGIQVQAQMGTAFWLAMQGQVKPAQARMRELAKSGDGWRVPPNPTPADTSSADLEWISPRRVDMPIRCFESKLRLQHGELTLPRSYNAMAVVASGIREPRSRRSSTLAGLRQCST